MTHIEGHVKWLKQELQRSEKTLKIIKAHKTKYFDTAAIVAHNELKVRFESEVRTYEMCLGNLEHTLALEIEKRKRAKDGGV